MTSSSPDIAVLIDPAYSDQCLQLAHRLQLKAITAEDAANFPYVLTYSPVGSNLVGLCIQQTGPKADGPVYVDFAAGTTDHRRKFGGGELIVKAVGGNKASLPTVLDTTAGLGRDSFVLANANYQVTMCERSPLVAEVLGDGLLRAEQSENEDLRAVIGRMTLYKQDAVSYMQTPEAKSRADVIVIDPMFPESKKKALVKKDMRAFHHVVGADQDSDQLLESALALATHRVVVKRPKKAEHLAARKPNFSVSGKAIRFDVYSLKAFSS